MKRLFALLALSGVFGAVAASSLTVYQDPNCGCCEGWAEHMRESGFEVKTVKTNQIWAVKERLGVPAELGSCHTAVLDETGQIVEGHVPASVVTKLLNSSNTKGVAAPGMPLNAPGMGELDGNLVTVDFKGRPFSRD
ncbi:CopG family transcriptional regulator [Paenalcaligenes niemegkensis]|uniref:DUF411 domain-containing protein n=1 Tax=Paenalcaligenes niemegkensis TaxID=2895469 RepID=UPI001EE957D3|nr:DUF411 domain-containing protein [Paenalcaligenes niemegkensis]MCQ9618360.1 CopG family transcriptional regulator [Paenalcaligenes niemegkensis]